MNNQKDDYLSQTEDSKKLQILQKMWRTLKAESGDRATKGNLPFLDSVTLRTLMERMETRVNYKDPIR